MKSINVFTSKTIIPELLIHPLRHCKNMLYERGYKINILYKLTKKTFSCDILLLLSKPILEYVKENKLIINRPSPTVDLLLQARRYTNKIIWMDTSDSTGVTHFELLPYIDLYLKKQLNKDKSTYQNPFYGGRIYSDYYHNEFGIEDSDIFTQFFPLSSDDKIKIGLSWNIGIGDIVNCSNKIARGKLVLPDLFPPNYQVRYTNPITKKKYDIFIRTNSNLSRESITFQRQETIKRLDEIIKRNELSGSTTGKWLPMKEYREMMMGTKIMPSPFGWGAITVRDYESFIYGAALLKPDMSFLETWPNVFIEGETYQPVKWDFTDLESSILELLEDDNKRVQIATNGQEAYKNSISNQGMLNFCNWFIQQIEK